MNARAEATPAVAASAALAAAVGLVASNLLTQPAYHAVERSFGATAAMGFGALISETGLLAPLVTVMLIARLDWVASLGLRRPRLQPTLAALLATAGGGIIVDQAMFYTLRLVPGWRGGNLDAVGRLIADAELGGALLLVLPLAVAPALVEEALCRGLLLRGLLRQFPSGWTPLLVSAAFFGALHFDPLHIWAALLMGLLLGWIALRTGSLWPPVLCHLLNNTSSLLTPALGGPGLTDVLDHGHSWPVLGAGLGALVVGFRWLHLTTRREPTNDARLQD